MRVAISTEGDFVSDHFGRCPIFTIVDIEDGKAVKKESIDNPGHQPGLIPQFLHQRGISWIVAGGMGARAQGLFAEFGIKTIMGVNGKVTEVIDKLVKGTLIGGESLCKPGAGKGYGLDKTECNHSNQETCER